MRRSPSTRAGKFVRKEIHHVRGGRHGARSSKQAIAIGLSKARRSGVKVPAPRRSGGAAQGAARTFPRAAAARAIGAAAGGGAGRAAARAAVIGFSAGAVGADAQGGAPAERAGAEGRGEEGAPHQGPGLAPLGSAQGGADARPLEIRRMDTEVLIVGAGPTGLVLALWLARLGIRPRIIDKTAESGTTSRALALQARTLELYRQLGFADEVVDLRRLTLSPRTVRYLCAHGAQTVAVIGASMGGYRSTLELQGLARRCIADASIRVSLGCRRVTRRSEPSARDELDGATLEVVQECPIDRRLSP